MKPIDYIFYWEFPPGTIPDPLIDYTLEQAKSKQRMDGQIGDGSVNKEIRSVERTPISEFDPISVYLYGCALKANDAQFKFDLGGPCQFEMLHYDKQGDHYDCHIDTVMFDNWYARKLTVMGYLNDDYEGGKFYFVTHSNQKQYVNVKKGTVLVFPPFIMHGVEPVDSGVRESVVGWITGPNFK